MKKLVSILLCGALLVGFSACKKNKYQQAASGNHSGFAYVDLGLPSGTMWATCNIGAKTPNAEGHHFSWGETKKKSRYNSEDYKYGKELSEYTKYTGLDNKYVLDPEDDAAHVQWGGNWRMPTFDEQSELREKCSWSYVEDFAGLRVTGPNGNSIFLPLVGLKEKGASLWEGGWGAYYWSATMPGHRTDAAYTLAFNSEGARDCNNTKRYRGAVIRPVFKP